MEAIRLDNVSLIRRTQEEFSYDLKKTLLSFLEGKYRKPSRRCVLDNISLVIEAGEKVGIIGSNGSGKSTLLKVICNILEPTSGKVRVKGNIAPLIELGAGFDSDMSVVENIILYGVMLGFAEQEMRRRIPEILEFAELEDYISVPVKALSSGMVARLGFAIATDIQPDILILDEVLSVGDESFRNKSKQRIEKFWQDHATILLVSHDLEFVRKSCECVIWMEHGEIRLVGESSEVIDAYITSVKQIDDLDEEINIHQIAPAPDQIAPAPDQIAPAPEEVIRQAPYGEALIQAPSAPLGVIIQRVFIANLQKQLVDKVPYGNEFLIGIEYTVQTSIQSLQFGLYLVNDKDTIILEPASHNFLPVTGEICALGIHCIYVKVPAPLLKPGVYYIDGVGAHNPTSGPLHWLIERLLQFHVVLSESDETEWFGQEVVHPHLEWMLE